MAVKPINPNDVVNLQAKLIPDYVIESFNTLIAQNFRGGVARVEQEDVIKEIIRRSNIERHAIFDNHYLDVESLYRAEGWKVEYDKPAYCESFKAYFEFRK